MPVNDSFSTNDSLPSQSNIFLLPQCLDNIIASYMFGFTTFTNILFLLPLSVLVLNLGFKRWKQQRSVSSASSVSFSDCFTFNMAAVELIGVLGFIINICGTYSELNGMIGAGLSLVVFPWNGQMFFPMLTCVERYLAVVHPITYLQLRKGGSVRIRNVSTVFVWLLCFMGGGSLTVAAQNPLTNLAPCVILVFLIIATSFCCISVLRVLVRPRPGEVGGNRVRVDRSKKRAFQTIVIIMGVLLLRFAGNLIGILAGLLVAFTDVRCVVVAAVGWFNLPSSLALPLLFLHRAGKLPGCKHNTESG